MYDASPDSYWRLDDTSGTVAKDITPNTANGVYSGGVTLGAPGVIVGTGAAVTLNGSNGLISSATSETAPSVYSEELWFKTTTTSGGKIIGFGSSQTGPSGSYDRHVYMINNGQLVFGTWTGQTNTITTPASYNDGAWHYLVATQGSDGMKLYVDGAVVGTNPTTGAQAYTGYWRVGGDTTWGGNSSNYFAGTVDEVAVYSSELSAAQVGAHFAKVASAANVLPTASFTSAATDLNATFDGTGSTDSDGTVKSWAWNFGDGTTGIGSTLTHTYAAAGLYSVALTVTDDEGGTNTVSEPITVVAANVLPTASFTSSATNLKATFDGTGSTDSDGTVQGYAWAFGDGAAGSGSTTTHTYPGPGRYAVVLTVTDNQGGTNVVNHSITVSAANVLPTASFTSSATNLTATFDGTGSTDSDGTVQSYAWSFGDGATGSGATMTHTYTAGGVYSVTLTVTDNRGGTNAVSNNISIVAPGTPAQYSSDAFGRTVASGFGTADLGGAWSLTGKSSTFSVSNGAGRMVMAIAGASSAAYLANVSSSDTQVQVGVALDQIQTGGGTYISVIGRRINVNTDYRVKLRFLAGGAVNETLERVVGGVETTLSTVNVAGLTYTPGSVLEVELQVTGTSPTSLRSMVWLQGSLQPTTWQLSTTDNTVGLQLAGAVALLVYLSASSTTFPETASFTAFGAGATH